MPVIAGDVSYIRPGPGIQVVEPRGLEPLTPCLQSRCATNCAKAPRGGFETLADARSSTTQEEAQAFSTLSVACCHRACSCLPWSIFFFAKTAPATAMVTSRIFFISVFLQRLESGPKRT